MYTLLTYEDSKGKVHSVKADDLDGRIEVRADQDLVNTTSLDIKKIVEVKRVED